MIVYRGVTWCLRAFVDEVDKRSLPHSIDESVTAGQVCRHWSLCLSYYLPLSLSLSLFLLFIYEKSYMEIDICLDIFIHANIHIYIYLYIYIYIDIYIHIYIYIYLTKILLKCFWDFFSTKTKPHGILFDLIPWQKVFFFCQFFSIGKSPTPTPFKIEWIVLKRYSYISIPVYLRIGFLSFVTLTLLDNRLRL